MTALGLRFAPRAWRQIEAADEWWRTHRERAPTAFYDELVDALRRLRSAPEIGASYPSVVRGGL